MPDPGFGTATALAPVGGALVHRGVAWVVVKVGGGVMGAITRWALERWLPPPMGRMCVEARKSAGASGTNEWYAMSDFVHGYLLFRNNEAFNVKLGRVQVVVESPWGRLQGEVPIGEVPAQSFKAVGVSLPYGNTFAKRAREAGANSAVRMVVKITRMEVLAPWLIETYTAVLETADSFVRNEGVD